MVSEKLIIALITIAIILSVVSVIVTISSINTKMIPQINPNPRVIPDDANAQVGIVVTPPVDRSVP